MRVKALLAALSPLRIKRNLMFLNNQGERILGFFYAMGLLVRSWALYHYMAAVAATVSTFLVSVGWVEMLANAGGYALAVPLSVLAVLSLRGWLSGLAFIAFIPHLASPIVIAANGWVLNYLNYSSVATSVMFYQALMLLPLMLLQFSMFKRSALKVFKPSSSSWCVIHDDDDDEGVYARGMMDGPEFFDMHSGTGVYGRSYDRTEF